MTEPIAGPASGPLTGPATGAQSEPARVPGPTAARGRRDLLLTVANSPWLIAGVLCGLLALGAVTHWLVEGGSLGDGLWWSVVTGTTVGYGDISPQVAVQRVVAVSIMLGAILLTQLLTAHITNRLVRDDNVFTHEEQEEMKAILRDVRTHMFTSEEQQQVLSELAALRRELAETRCRCAGEPAAS